MRWPRYAVCLSSIRPPLILLSAQKLILVILKVVSRLSTPFRSNVVGRSITGIVGACVSSRY